jgi:hypothetical protein
LENVARQRGATPSSVVITPVMQIVHGAVENNVIFQYGIGALLLAYDATFMFVENKIIVDYPCISVTCVSHLDYPG